MKKNFSSKYFLKVLWLLVNGFLFAWFYLKYDKGDEWFYLRLLIGPNLAVARGSAACLNFNCMLILIPVCRNFLAFVRRNPFLIK